MSKVVIDEKDIEVVDGELKRNNLRKVILTPDRNLEMKLQGVNIDYNSNFNSKKSYWD